MKSLFIFWAKIGVFRPKWIGLWRVWNPSNPPNLYFVIQKLQSREWLGPMNGAGFPPFPGIWFHPRRGRWRSCWGMADPQWSQYPRDHISAKVNVKLSFYSFTLNALSQKKPASEIHSSHQTIKTKNGLKIFSVKGPIKTVRQLKNLPTSSFRSCKYQFS